MIQFDDIKLGEGDEVQDGQQVEVAYVGSFPDGKVFDQGKFGFKVGAGMVIQGFDLMVLGMKVGGTRKATIPPELGYGSRGAGAAIPPNATLVFEVTVLGVK